MIIINIKPHHKFLHNGKTYVLNIEDMKACAVSEDTLTALEIGSGVHFCSLTPEIEDELRHLNLMPSESETINETSTLSSSPIRNIALFVTQDCNLACTYCYGNEGGYGSSGHMSWETAKRTIDWLIEQSCEVKTLGVAFFGGEPLLNYLLVKEVVSYARERGVEAGKEFEFSITTNASLLNDEIISFLKNYEVKIGRAHV